MLNTYCIIKPDGGLYEFTAEIQKLPTAPRYFTITGRTRSHLIISLSDLLIKTMLGDFVNNSSDGEEQGKVLSSDINSNILFIEFDTRASFPFAVSYRDSRNVPVFTIELSREDFDNLSFDETFMGPIIEDDFLIGR